MATLKDVAAAAQVSITTASRVLNRDESFSVTDQTRKNVLQAASALGYARPTGRHKSSGTVALFQWYPDAEGMSTDYYSTIRQAVEAELTAVDLGVVRYFPGDSMPSLSRFAGVLALGKFSPAQLDKIANRDQPLIVIDQDVLARKISCVVPDFAGGIGQVVAHMKQTGIKRPLFLAGQEHASDGCALADPRTRFFPQLAAQAGLTLAATLTGDFTMNGAYKLIAQFLAKHPAREFDAIFAANDEMGIGVLKALHERGIKVPSQVAVYGFNDLNVGQFVSPALTSVRVRSEELGAAAVQLLQTKLEGSLKFPLRITPESELILRGSTNNRNLNRKEE